MIYAKNAFFTFHYCYILSSLFGWVVHPYFLSLPVITMSSWYFNDNKCLITQTEHYLFGKTITGEAPKFRVPCEHRLFQATSFLTGCYVCIYKWVLFAKPQVIDVRRYSLLQTLFGFDYSPVNQPLTLYVDQPLEQNNGRDFTIRVHYNIVPSLD